MVRLGIGGEIGRLLEEVDVEPTPLRESPIGRAGQWLWDEGGFGPFTAGVARELTWDMLPPAIDQRLPQTDEMNWVDRITHGAGQVVGALPQFLVGAKGIRGAQQLATRGLARQLPLEAASMARQAGAWRIPQAGASAVPRISRAAAEGAARLGTIAAGRQAAREYIRPTISPQHEREPGAIPRIGEASMWGMGTGAILGAIGQTFPEAKFKLYRFGQIRKAGMPDKMYRTASELARSGVRQDSKNPGIFIGPDGTKYTATVEYKGKEMLLPDLVKSLRGYPKPGIRDLPRFLFTQKPYDPIGFRGAGYFEHGARAAPTADPYLAAREHLLRIAGEASPKQQALTKAARAFRGRTQPVTSTEVSIIPEIQRGVVGREEVLTHLEGRGIPVSREEPYVKEALAIRPDPNKERGVVTRDEGHYAEKFREWLESGMPSGKEPVPPSIEAEIAEKSGWKGFDEQVKALQAQLEPTRPPSPYVQKGGPVTRDEEHYTRKFREWLEGGMRSGEEPVPPSTEAEIAEKSKWRGFEGEVETLKAQLEPPTEPLPAEPVEIEIKDVISKVRAGQDITVEEELTLTEEYKDLAGGKFMRSEVEKLPIEEQEKLARLVTPGAGPEREMLNIQFTDETLDYLRDLGYQRNLIEKTPEAETPNQEMYLHKLAHTMRKKGVDKDERKVVIDRAKRMMEGAEKAGINLHLTVDFADRISEKLTSELLASHGLKRETNAYVAGRTKIESDGKVFRAALEILTNRNEPMSQEIIHEFAEVWTAAWEMADPSDYNTAVDFLVDKGLTEERAREHLTEIITDYALSGSESDTREKDLLDRLKERFKEWVLRVMDRLHYFLSRVWPNLPDNIRRQAKAFSQGRWEEVFRANVGKKVDQQVRHHIHEKGLAKPFYSRLRRYIEELPQDKWGKNEIISKLKKAPKVKKDELYWSGALEYIEAYPGKSVPKQDLLNNLQDIEFEETLLSRSNIREDSMEYELTVQATDELLNELSEVESNAEIIMEKGLIFLNTPDYRKLDSMRDAALYYTWDFHNELAKMQQKINDRRLDETNYLLSSYTSALDEIEIEADRRESETAMIKASEAASRAKYSIDILKEKIREAIDREGELDHGLTPTEYEDEYWTPWNKGRNYKERLYQWEPPRQFTREEISEIEKKIIPWGGKIVTRVEDHDLMGYSLKIPLNFMKTENVPVEMGGGSTKDQAIRRFLKYSRYSELADRVKEILKATPKLDFETPEELDLLSALRAEGFEVLREDPQSIEAVNQEGLRFPVTETITSMAENIISIVTKSKELRDSLGISEKVLEKETHESWRGGHFEKYPNVVGWTRFDSVDLVKRGEKGEIILSGELKRLGEEQSDYFSAAKRGFRSKEIPDDWTVEEVDINLPDIFKVPKKSLDVHKILLSDIIRLDETEDHFSFTNPVLERLNLRVEERKADEFFTVYDTVEELEFSSRYSPVGAVEEWFNSNLIYNKLKDRLGKMLPEEFSLNDLALAVSQLPISIRSIEDITEKTLEELKEHSFWIMKNAHGKIVACTNARYTHENEAINIFRKVLKSEDNPPPAPFSETGHWSEYFFKREIRDAVASGAEGIVWSDGVVQAIRGNLAYYGVSSVRWSRLPVLYNLLSPPKVDTEIPGFVEDFNSVDPKDWTSDLYRYRLVFNKKDRDDRPITLDIVESELAEKIGRGLAEEIMNSPQSEGSIETDPKKLFGKQGKITLYGELNEKTGEYKTGIHTKFLPKYLKQWGARIEMLEYQEPDGTIRKAPGTLFNEQMKYDVMYEGQPLSIKDKKRDAILETYKSIDWEGKGQPPKEPEKKPTPRVKKTPETKKLEKAERKRRRIAKKEEKRVGIPTEERPAVRKTEKEVVKEMREVKKKKTPPKGETHEPVKKKPTITKKDIVRRAKAQGFKDLEHAKLSFEAMELGRAEWIRRLPEMHKGFLKTYVKEGAPEKMYEDLIKHVKDMDVPQYNKLKSQVKALINKQRDFTKEQKTQIRDWRKELKDIIKKKKIRPEYRREIDSLMSEIDWGAFKRTKTKVERLKKTREWLKYNEDSYMPERVVKELGLLDKVPLGKLTFPQIEQLVDAVKNLAHLSDLKNALIFKRQRKALDETVKEVRANLKKAHPVIKETDREISTIDTMVRSKEPGYVKKIFTSEQLMPEFITQLIQGQEEGLFKKILYDDIDQGVSDKYGTYFEQMHKFRNTAKEVLGENWKNEIKSWSSTMNKKIRQVKTVKVKLDKERTIKLTPDERMAIYLHSLDSKGKQELIEGGFRVPLAEGILRKISDKDISAIVKSMPEKEKKVADHISREINTTLRDKINQVSTRLQGVNLATEKNYFPQHRSHIRKKNDPIPEFRPKNFSQRVLDNMQLLKPRREAGKPLLLRGAIETYHMYVQDASTYAGLAEPIRNARMVIRDEGLTEDFTKIRYRHYQKTLERYLDDVEGHFENQGVVDELTRKLLNPIHTAILGLNPGIMLKQTTSYMAAATEMDSKYLLKAIPSNVKKAWGEMKKWEPQNEFRDQGKINRETGEIGEVGTILQWATGKTFLPSKFTEGIRWFDRKVVGKIWNAVKAEVSEKKPELKGDDYWKAVAKRHRDIVNKTQPTYLPHTRSSIGRSNSPFVRGLTPFHTQRNKNYNIKVRSFWRYNNSGKTPEDKAKLFKALAIMFLAVPIYLMSIDEIRDRLYKRNVKRTIATNIVSGIGNIIGNAYIIGPVFDSIVSKIRRGTWAGHKWTSPFYATAWEFTDAVADTVSAVNHALTQERYTTGTKAGEKRWKTDARRAVDSTATFMGKMWGYPYHNAKQLTEAAIKNIAPDTEFKIDTITRNPQASYYYGAMWDSIETGRTGRAEDNMVILIREFGVSHRDIQRSYQNRPDLSIQHYTKALEVYNKAIARVYSR